MESSLAKFGNRIIDMVVCNDGSREIAMFSIVKKVCASVSLEVKVTLKLKRTEKTV